MFRSRLTLLSAFYIITQSFNSISYLKWKFEERQRSVGKVGIGEVMLGLKLLLHVIDFFISNAY